MLRGPNIIHALVRVCVLAAHLCGMLSCIGSSVSLQLYPAALASRHSLHTLPYMPHNPPQELPLL